MRQTLTDGSVVIRNDHCKCGLTAGCENCQPIIIRPVIEGVDYVVVNPTYRVIRHEFRFEKIRINIPVYVEAFRSQESCNFFHADMAGAEAGEILETEAF